MNNDAGAAAQATFHTDAMRFWRGSAPLHVMLACASLPAVQ